MIEYRDTWPTLTPWQRRHEPFNQILMGEQRVCVTCRHLYTPGHYRAHLRSVAHRDNRGWWK